jgi:hypothetical protein
VTVRDPADSKEIPVTLSDLVRSRFRWLAIGAGLLILPVLSHYKFPSTATAKRPRSPGVQSASDLQLLMAAYGADAVTIDRNMRDFKAPDQVVWTSRPGSTSQTANVFGDPSKPGLYVQLLKRGPDDWSQPHAHPNDRYITVLAGTMKIGTGSKFDQSNTVSLGPGSFIKDVAGQMHYDGTGPEGLTIQIVGIGPSSRIQ